jgi:hypothetical protein
MVASNKQAMDMMFECMNALIASHGKEADKVTAPPANNNTGCTSSNMKRNRKKCTNCKKTCLSQARRLLRAQDQCKQALARMETGQECQCNSLIGTIVYF